MMRAAGRATLRWLACAAAVLAGQVAAAAEAPSDMAASLARINLLGGTAPEVLAAVSAAGAPAAPASVCGGTGAASTGPAGGTTGLMVLVPLPPRCDVAGEVVGVSIGPAAWPEAQAVRLASLLAPTFGPPCFKGALRNGAGRRAPPPFTTAWAQGTRILALTRASPSSRDATVLYADLAPRTERAGPVLDLLADLVPPQCRKPAGG